MADWEKWQDLTAVDCSNGPPCPKLKGSCVDLDANSKWIATCQKDYHMVSWYLTNYKNPQSLYTRYLTGIKKKDGISFSDRH